MVFPTSAGKCDRVNKKSKGKYEDRLTRVLTYMYENLDGDLSLDKLAEVACMSRFHWHRVFRAMTGETLSEAVRRLRLLEAANVLVAEDTPIADIASRYGYVNQASFSRAFKKVHGLSPADLRKQGLQDTALMQQASGDSSMHPVIITELPEKNAAGILQVGPYTRLGPVFHKLGGLIATHDLFDHIEELVVVYHDAPGSKPDEELRAHVAVTLHDSCPRDLKELEYFDITGGKHAIMQHKGPYSTLAAAYEWFYGKWLPQSDEEPRDAPPVEHYVNDPRKTPAPELRTDIRLPLA